MGDPHNLNEIHLVEQIFQTARGPVRFDDLVATIAEIRGIRDEPLTEIDERASSDETPIDEKLSLREFAVTLWSEIKMLPIRQRIALLLSFRDPQGGSATALLVSSGVAGIREIAAILEMPVTEFAGMWNSLPFDDAEIASKLENYAPASNKSAQICSRTAGKANKKNETKVTVSNHTTLCRVANEQGSSLTADKRGYVVKCKNIFQMRRSSAFTSASSNRIH